VEREPRRALLVCGVGMGAGPPAVGPTGREGKGLGCGEREGLTIGSKTLPTTFFVISGKCAYNLLLWRDCIHANCCIPSTMH